MNYQRRKRQVSRYFISTEYIPKLSHMRIVLLILCFAIYTGVSAQISRSDLEKETNKGTALLKNGKLEDAIAIFNDILTQDPTEGKALLLRARTKHELGAYKGAKNDCFTYMDIYGIDEDVAGLLGKTEMAQENYKQALAYLKVAIMFDPEGVEYLMDRADIFYNLGLDEQACEDWDVAVENGSERAQRLMEENCRKFLREKQAEILEREAEAEARRRAERQMESERMREDTYIPEDLSDESDSMTETDSTTYNQSGMENTEETAGQNDDSSEVDSSSYVKQDSIMEEIPEVTYPIDNSVEEIFIDDELTILISDGIGSRKVTEIPDILILSDKSGEVVVDVCIDRLGRILDPKLNEDRSTIKTPSLVSLALRESSNFRFARSSRKNHCGSITFVITGSE